MSKRAFVMRWTQPLYGMWTTPYILSGRGQMIHEIKMDIGNSREWQRR